MLIGEMIDRLHKLYDDEEAYRNLLLSLMDEYGVDCLQTLTYYELKEFYKKHQTKE